LISCLSLPRTEVLGYFLVQTGSMVYRMYREDG
jgi:hypothetical protein